jgi:multicomponent Na+:H+ antiporter subunit E
MSWVRRVAALSCWAFGVWVLLTWTRTLEQLAFGVAVAIVVAVALAPLGDTVGPWQLLTPRRLAGAVALLWLVARGIVTRNVRLARLIWSPRRRPRSGIIIVPTAEHSAGGLTAIGLITSAIVDNQLVDLDRSADELQYHAVEVSSETGRATINGPVEDKLAAFDGGR